MGCKKPGRVRLICNKCEDKFSTHSSNRKVCHKCLPKCREKHDFIAREINQATKDKENLKEKAGTLEKNLEHIDENAIVI